MFNLKREDRVVIVSKREWEEMQADVRGLKRLVDLDAQARAEQDKRFAAVMDELERRLVETNSIVAAFADAQGRTTTEFSNRTQRAEAAIAALEMNLATLLENSVQAGLTRAQTMAVGHEAAV